MLPTRDGGPSAGTPELAWETRLEELYVASGAEKYGLGRREFAAMLGEIAGSAAAPGAGPAEMTRPSPSLHVEELALARGCAAGNERAWEDFLSRYRERLYRAARGIAGSDTRGRELADSLYAELYGTRLRQGQRASKLLQYSGRGSLEGWLRMVLAQEFINGCRQERRMVSLDEMSENGERWPAPDSEPASAPDPRAAAATDEALAAISAEERYLLASYYLDEATLASIARTLGLHESTISRRLGKLVKTLRDDILGGLMRRGMSRRQAEEALETDVRDVGLDIRRRLTQDSDGAAFSEEKAAPGGEAER